MKRIISKGLLVGMVVSTVAPFWGKKNIPAQEQKNIKPITAKVTHSFKTKIEKEKYIKEQEEKRIAEEAIKAAQNVKKINYVDMDTPSNNSFKSYMDYRTLSVYSEQGKMQAQSYTDGLTGIIIYDGRYCVAVGSGYTHTLGTYIDLIMENGSIIKCIVADAKSDEHTDTTTRRQNANGSIVEFIVDTKVIDGNVRLMGNFSYLCEDFSGEIKYIRIYDMEE